LDKGLDKANLTSSLETKTMDRRKEPGGIEHFANVITSPEVIGEAAIDRHIQTNVVSNFSGLDNTAYVNFINLTPERWEQGRGGGAECMNNRWLFKVSGFAEDGGPSPRGKMSVECVTCFLPFKSPDKMRKKTGNYYDIVKYLAEYIGKIRRTYPPKLTHE